MHTPEPAPAHDRLLEHQAFLRQLARSLVADPHRAEDLAQEATLIALQRPPRPGPMGAWLARVVRNLSISGSRSEGRRVAREQTAHRPEPPRTPEELETHFEVQRRVVDAVGRLEEPYKSTILLRYYHDLGPAAIAEQQGVSAATVKTRLARGLAKLRTDLDQHDVDGTPAWALVLLGGLDESQRTVIGSALAAGGASMVVKLTLAGAVAAVGAIAGTWWMLQPAVDPSARLDLLGGSAGTPSAVAEAESSGLHAPPSEQSRAAVEAPATARPANEKGAPSFPWTLDLELRGWQDGDAGPVAIHVGRDAQDDGAVSVERAPAPHISLDVGALFAEVEARPSQLLLRIDHPAYLPAEVGVLVPEDFLRPEVGTGRLRAALDLVGAKAVVTGRVELAGERTGDSARVAIFPLQGERPASEPTESVRLDVQGRFRLRADAADRHVVVAYVDPIENLGKGHLPTCIDPSRLAGPGDSVPGLRPESRVLTLARDQELEIEPMALGEGVVVEGRVEFLGGGTPPPGHVRALLQDQGGIQPADLVWMGGRFEMEHQESVWDANGGYRVTGLGPHSYALNAMPANQWVCATTENGQVHQAPLRIGTQESEVVVKAPASDAQLKLSTVSVTVEVRGAGSPISGAAVGVHTSKVKGESRSTSSMWTKTDQLGRAAIELDPRDGLQLSVTEGRFPKKDARFEPVDLIPNAVLVVELDGAPSDPATLAIRFAGDAKSVEDGALIDLLLYNLDKSTAKELERQLGGTRGSSGNHEITYLWPDSAIRLQRTESEGAWTLAGIPPGKYLVRISPRSPEGGPACMLLETDFEVVLPAGELVEHTWEGSVGGRVRLNLIAGGDSAQGLRDGVIEDAAGNQLSVTFRGQGRIPGSISTYSLIRSPGVHEVVPALAAGDYALALTLQDRTKRTIRFRVEAGHVNDVEIDLSKP